MTSELRASVYEYEPAVLAPARDSRIVLQRQRRPEPGDLVADPDRVRRVTAVDYENRRVHLDHKEWRDWASLEVILQ